MMLYIILGSAQYDFFKNPIYFQITSLIVYITKNQCFFSERYNVKTKNYRSPELFGIESNLLHIGKGVEEYQGGLSFKQ